MVDYLKLIIRQAGKLALDYYKKGVSAQTKADPTDLVTEADYAVNDFLVKKILKKFPTHGIISEELKDEINPGAQYIWVIDPIDGTHNFANHIAFWCVMVAVLKNGKPYLGAVYDALNDELYFAEVGKGAFLNGRRIKAGNCQDMKSFRVVFSSGEFREGSPYSPKRENFNRYIRWWNNLNGKDGHWIHNMGSMLSFCHLAAGQVDAGIYNAGLLHDYLPAYVIATEAGAKWTNSHGKPWKFGEKDIVVANPKLHKKLLKLFE